jgi:hypothetical protein
VSASRFGEGADLVQTWFPEAERFVLPGAGHLLMLQNAPELARRLSRFFSGRPAEAVSGGGRGPVRR